MASFYVLVLSALTAGFFVGYKTGGIKLLFYTFQLTAAVTAAFILYPMVAEWFFSFAAAPFQWLSVFSFFTVLFTVFTLLHFLFTAMEGNRPIVHWANRIAGSVMGLLIAAAATIGVIGASGVVPVPQKLQAVMAASGISNFLNSSAEWLDHHTLAVLETPVTKVMASEKADSVVHEAVTLPFATGDVEVRPDLEVEMLKLLNQERKKRGLAPLRQDVTLTAVARAHSADMFKRGYFSHSTPNGVDPFQRLRQAKVRYLFAGENLALAPTLSRAHTGLMNSPGHRANILHTAYGKVGIGILKAGKHGLMVTQVFRD
jgi:uncharacterized protein YkwD